MAEPKDLFLKDFGRKIETVIKADDQENVYQEVDEYVITREISNKLANFFEFYSESGKCLFHPGLCRFFHFIDHKYYLFVIPKNGLLNESSNFFAANCFQYILWIIQIESNNR